MRAYASRSGDGKRSEQNLNLTATENFRPTQAFTSQQPQQQQQPRRPDLTYESPRHQKHPQYPQPAVVTQIQQPSISASYYSFDMSSIYGDNQRDFTHYPPIDEPQEHDDNMHPRYPSPGTSLNNPYNNPSIDAPINMDLPELPSKAESDPSSPGRSRAIPKPDREITKDTDGRFICTWPACTEDTKVFNRKCEWSKVSEPPVWNPLCDNSLTHYISIWTSMIDLTSAQLTVAKNFPGLHIRGVY